MAFAEYLHATSGRKHSPLLEKAFTYVKNIGFALDLGAGTLGDTRFLLSKGFAVDAVDSESSFVDFGKDVRANLIVSTFDSFDFPIVKYDLINARYSLPFNPPETFNAMFARLFTALKPSGIFVGQFFGAEDSWSSNGEMTFLAKEQIESLLKDFNILHLEEIKKKGETALGSDKFWHVFDVIAQKR